MTYWEGVVLGVVQGLTEFLPISSSGHLVVTEAAVGLSTPGVTVEVALHVGTLLAVVLVYRSRILALARGVLTGNPAAGRYVMLLAVGSVPAGIIGLAFAEVFERMFDSLLVVGIDFMVTGAILWSTRLARLRAHAPEPSWGGALGVGAAQALAILPGISRSGATVAAAMWLGVDPVRAAEYSFLLAIPAIAGASLLQIPELGDGILRTVGGGPLLLSFITSMAAGVFAIRFLVVVLLRGTFHRFAPYCWLLGASTILWALAS
jgi:undecaprenyl-diphosphatase